MAPEIGGGTLFFLLSICSQLLLSVFTTCIYEEDINDNDDRNTLMVMIKVEDDEKITFVTSLTSSLISSISSLETLSRLPSLPEPGGDGDLDRDDVNDEDDDGNQ